jgi:hypothetical protein
VILVSGFRRFSSNTSNRRFLVSRPPWGAPDGQTSDGQTRQRAGKREVLGAVPRIYDVGCNMQFKVRMVVEAGVVAISQSPRYSHPCPLASPHLFDLSSSLISLQT